MNRMVGPLRPIIFFQPLPQAVRGDADNGIYLRVKRFRAPKGVHRNAVLLDFVDCSFEVLFANKSQKPNKVVRPPEDTGRQEAVYFNPLGLKLADRRLQMTIPLKMVPSTHPPVT